MGLILQIIHCLSEIEIELGVLDFYVLNLATLAGESV